MKKLIIFASLSLLILFPLYINNTLKDFINYAFGGLFEFGEKNINFSITPYLIILTFLPFIIYFIILKQKNKTLKNIITDNIFQNATILIIFTFFMSFILYPIANTAHLLFVIPIHFIFIFYILDVIMLEDFFGDNQFIKPIKWINILLLLSIVIRIVFHYIFIAPNHSFITEKTSHYYSVMINNKTIEKTDTLKEYIVSKNNEGIDVIITSCDSAFPMIELNQSHGVYDLLFNGNLGYNGKEKIKKDILNRKNTEFLVVTNENELSYQESPEIRNFIIQNLNFEGYIENYSIYSNY